MSFKFLLKVEFYFYFEGVVLFVFICGLVKEKNIDISGIFDENGGYLYCDFEYFLLVYEVVCIML